MIDHGKFPMKSRVAPVGLSGVFIFGGGGGWCGGVLSALARPARIVGVLPALLLLLLLFIILALSFFIFFNDLFHGAVAVGTMQNATLLWFDFFWTSSSSSATFLAAASASIAAALVLRSAALLLSAVHTAAGCGCWRMHGVQDCRFPRMR